MTVPTVNRLKHENIGCETIKATKIRVLDIKGYYSTYLLLVPTTLLVFPNFIRNLHLL